MKLSGGDRKPLGNHVDGAELEISYLRRNVEHLRSQKRCTQQQVLSLERQLRSMEQLYWQYRALSEQAHSGVWPNAGGGEIEISNLHQQLDAVMVLKDALNIENLELQRRVKAAEQEVAECHKSERGVCVVCMENLSNVVCLPCKHLALCSSCSQEALAGCPICRRDIDDKLTIFIP